MLHVNRRVVLAFFIFVGLWQTVVYAHTAQRALAATHSSTEVQNNGTIPPLAIALTAPLNGFTDSTITFSATVSPSLAATPITYTWTATDTPTKIRLGNLSDSAKFLWSEAGIYTVSVQAANNYGMVSTSRQITIQETAIVVPVAALSVEGTSGGLVDEVLHFTATVSPLAASLPITYLWQPQGLTTTEQVTGSSSAITLSWSHTGTFPITVSAVNQGAVITGYFTVEVKMLAPLGIIIDGPDLVTVGEPVTFTISLLPTNSGQPVTYLWFASHQTPITQTGGSSDQATFVWQQSGSMMLSVQASNAVGTVWGEKIVEVIDIPKQVYLPVIER